MSTEFITKQFYLNDPEKFEELESFQVVENQEAKVSILDKSEKKLCEFTFTPKNISLMELKHEIE